MKRVLSSDRSVCPSAKFALLLSMAAVLLSAGNVHAMPRNPFPPYPEPRPLYYESFDWNYFTGETNSDLTLLGLGVLDESWSGYALQRSGESVTPFIIPALNADGSTNISPGGSFRWWVRPYWTSGVPNSTPS